MTNQEIINKTIGSKYFEEFRNWAQIAIEDAMDIARKDSAIAFGDWKDKRWIVKHGKFKSNEELYNEFLKSNSNK